MSDLRASRLAHVRGSLELVSTYLYQVVSDVEHLRTMERSLAGAPEQIHLSNLKLIASELLVDAVDQLLEIAGLDDGYRRDSDLALERSFRDLSSATLNISNDRLSVATGCLNLFDQRVQLVSTASRDVG